jgi:hypothetical protein
LALTLAGCTQGQGAGATAALSPSVVAIVMATGTAAAATPAAGAPVAKITLPEGSECPYWEQGAALDFNGKRANYNCGPRGEDVVVLLGDLKTSIDALTVDIGILTREAQGYRLKEASTLMMRMTRVKLADGRECVQGGEGVNMVVDGRISRYSCAASGQEMIVLLGAFPVNGLTMVAEEALVAPAGEAFTLKSSQRVAVREIDGN